MKTRLIATSPSMDGIKTCITQYFAGTAYDVLADGSLRRVSDGYSPKMRVVKKGSRYRLEACEGR